MDWRDEQIKQLADKIREGAKGGFLYGEPIDINNIDQLLFLAYSMGQQSEREQTSKVK